MTEQGGSWGRWDEPKADERERVEERNQSTTEKKTNQTGFGALNIVKI